MELFAVAGLNHVPMDTISQRIAALGFNCIRLPLSIELWANDPLVPTIALRNGSSLLGSRGMGLLDATVSSLTRAGLLIILNDHTSAAGWCCDLNSEEGIWSNPAFDASRWLEFLGALAGRYRSEPMVIGFDLRNEIHE